MTGIKVLPGSATISRSSKARLNQDSLLIRLKQDYKIKQANFVKPSAYMAEKQK